MTHTPRPWRVEFEDDGVHTIVMGTALKGGCSYAPQHVVEYEHGLYADEEGPSAEQFAEAEANAFLMGAAADMEAALQAVLLFHGGGPWDADKSAEWLALTGQAEATTKVLCDAVRAALKKGKVLR